jgi:hypothetical protein
MPPQNSQVFSVAYVVSTAPHPDRFWGQIMSEYQVQWLDEEGNISSSEWVEAKSELRREPDALTRQCWRRSL